MAFHRSASRPRSGLKRAVVLATLFAAAAALAGSTGPAYAQRPTAAPQMQHAPPGRQALQQGAVSAEFRTALEPHGRWQQHARFGEVWVPSQRARDWRPYTVGRWVYTEDWGWYWAEDREEADWGWVAYHYGRWIDDADLGWAWIPGEEWGPGFVQWRHGGERVGWSPLPPDEIVVEYRERPDVWLFVSTRDFVAAPRLAAVMLPEREYSLYVRDTVVVNETVVLRDRGRFAVNPGIPATVIAAAVGSPIRAFDVRPRVLAGTAQIPGAMEIRAQDLRSGSLRTETTLRETRNEIRPTDRAAPLQPLGAGERGRLGDNPPRAAQRLGQQPGTQPLQPQQQQGQQQLPQPGQQPGPTQGRGSPLQQPQQGQQQPVLPQQQQGRGKQEPSQTQGRGAQEQLQQDQRLPQQQGQRPVLPQQQQGRGKQEPAQTPGRTEGRGGAVDTQRPLTEPRRAIEPQQRQPSPSERSGAREPRPDTGTSGGGGAVERVRPQERSGSEGARSQGPIERSPGAGTEGRGGRGAAGGGGGPIQPAPHAAPQGPARGAGGGTEGRGGVPGIR